jgi:sterol desaturase/sphingolipid hydroxylase (fatty acid hydroxylase superfamily)
MDRLLAALVYPVVMTLAFALFALLQRVGASLVVSTYVPVLATATVVTLLERTMPHREDWRPRRREVRTDVTFMVAVQLALPPLIGFLFAYALIEPAAALGLPFDRFWPHGWPIWIQAILMVLAVDFLRYWLHRAAHENDTLWRLHYKVACVRGGQREGQFKPAVLHYRSDLGFSFDDYAHG